MSRVQVILQDGKAAFVVVPIDLWERVREAVEEAEDIADLERFDREDDGVRYPAEVANSMAEGVHVLSAWREYRRLKQVQLAEASGLSKPFISQIESGARTGSVDTLERLAAALGVPIGALTE